MRVLVCGSRTFSDRDAIHSSLLSAWWSEPSQLVVIEGGARGADAIAAKWAQRFGRGVGHIQFPADWARYGKRAGFIRNRQMLDEGKPDVVLAFVDKPLAESVGTAMMVDLARKAGVVTHIAGDLA